MLLGHDNKTNNAFTELQSKYDEMLPKLIKLKEDAVKAELDYVDRARSAAQISTVTDLVYQTKKWALHMSDAATRLGGEIEAIESVAQRMVTYVHEKNAMIDYLSEAVKDVRYLHDRLQTGPITESEGTQTDNLDTSIDVSLLYKLWALLCCFLFSLILKISSFLR